ncbi:MAG: RtcB family protein [Clostridia bacterium]|nr:RtcB family protein [Clostridia bacterium]
MYDIKIYAYTCEGGCINQIYNLASQRAFRDETIRIMPDTHSGIGAVVGFTSTMRSGLVIPNVIGVDIGCGMRVYELEKRELDFPALDGFIKKNIPSGSDVRDTYYEEELIRSLYCFDKLVELDRLYGSLGTLGGGNHFIEIDKGEDGRLYLVIHTGSRNLGTQVAKIYQKIAVNECKHAGDAERDAVISRLKTEGRVDDIPEALKKITEKYAHKTKIPDELCYLEGSLAEDYLHDMRICQEFAKRNREMIGNEILKFLKIPRADYFESVHNFIDDDNIIRKGAIPAYSGERVLIPMNMRDGCIIGEGLSNPDWNFSAPHGAGRLMSRGEAKRTLNEDEFKAAMVGIYTTTANASTIDEAPMAYKPTEEILAQIGETVKIIEVIKPVYNFKASEL